jgi:hypothetical protein
MTGDLNVRRLAVSPGRMLVPLALAQFICSFAGSNMNVMINDISKDLRRFRDCARNRWPYGAVPVTGCGWVTVTLPR